MTAPTPLLDSFKRGEIAPEVKLLVAKGALAPRAHEQLGILMLLLEDPDPKIRAAASETMLGIPEASLRAFLARADVPDSMKEFFAARGIFPGEAAAVDAEQPLVDAEGEIEEEVPEGASEEERRLSVYQQVAVMGFSKRLQAAVKGSREMRGILIRDPNKLIALTVLSSPRLTEQEVESFSRMATLSEEILRVIAGNRAWMKNYGIVVGLAKNPKTPIALSLNLLARLNDRDLNMLSNDRNVPEPLRVAARKRVVAATSKK